jgi:Ca2+ transporting ATPase
MDVVRVWIDNKIHPYLLEEDYNPQAFSPDYFALLKEAICCNTTADLCHNPNAGQEGEEEMLEKGSKTEIALLKFLRAMGHTDYDDIRKEIEHRSFKRRFNFTSMRKRSSFVLSNDKEGGLRVHVKGAAEVILERSTHYTDTNAQPVEKDGDFNEKMLETINEFNSHGLRSIVMAYRNLPEGFDVESKDEKDNPAVESENLVLIAIIGIKDPIRPDVPKAVEDCKKAGIKVRMVTGDNTVTARAIADECHILEGDGPDRVMEGDKFYAAVGGMIKVCKGCKRKPCECSE